MPGLLNHGNCKIIKIGCLKSLSLWQCVTQQWQMNAFIVFMPVVWAHWDIPSEVEDSCYILHLLDLFGC